VRYEHDENNFKQVVFVRGKLQLVEQSTSVEYIKVNILEYILGMKWIRLHLVKQPLELLRSIQVHKEIPVCLLRALQVHLCGKQARGEVIVHVLSVWRNSIKSVVLLKEPLSSGCIFLQCGASWHRNDWSHIGCNWGGMGNGGRAGGGGEHWSSG